MSSGEMAGTLIFQLLSNVPWIWPLSVTGATLCFATVVGVVVFVGVDDEPVVAVGVEVTSVVGVGSFFFTQPAPASAAARTTRMSATPREGRTMSFRRPLRPQAQNPLEIALSRGRRRR